MSIARAFTSARRNKQSDSANTPLSPIPGRSASSRRVSGQKIKISAPLELISTTNMLSFTAPTIGSMSNSSSSGDESDSSHPRSPTTSPATSPEASSAPSPPESPEPNHLSAYFPNRSNTSGGRDGHRVNVSVSEKPAVPKRALTHTASSHSLARKRSMSKLAPPSSIHSPPQVTSRSSVGMFSEHPFSAELEQVSELAEEFGMSSKVLDEEEQILREKGLRKFKAEDYMMEILPLWGGVFEDELMPLAPGWI